MSIGNEYPCASHATRKVCAVYTMPDKIVSVDRNLCEFHSEQIVDELRRCEPLHLAVLPFPDRVMLFGIPCDWGKKG